MQFYSIALEELKVNIFLFYIFTLLPSVINLWIVSRNISSYFSSEQMQNRIIYFGWRLNQILMQMKYVTWTVYNKSCSFFFAALRGTIPKQEHNRILIRINKSCQILITAGFSTRKCSTDVTIWTSSLAIKVMRVISATFRYPFIQKISIKSIFDKCSMLEQT